MKYTRNISYNLIWNNNISIKFINKENHFYLDSFDVYSNHEKLKIEISRLIKNRDKYKNIHFHLKPRLFFYNILLLISDNCLKSNLLK